MIYFTYRDLKVKNRPNGLRLISSGDKNAETVIYSHLVDFVCTHGIPNALITDQGKEFCNKINDLFSACMDIDYRVASAYHPTTGGQTARFTQTMYNMLSRFVNAESNDWDTKLSYVLFAYRTAQHSSSKQEKKEDI